MNITILKFDSLESTNTTAIEHARQGAGEGLCIVARQQEAGRGRHGRVWLSGKDSGLYFSIVLRPKLEARFFTLLTLMTAVAVYDTLENLYGFKPDIKWPNDILINGRKICGILAESIETPEKQAVIVGIGLNLYSTDFPPALKAGATSIFAESGRRPDEEELLASITKFLIYFYEILSGEDGCRMICREWEGRSSYSNGKKVRVRSGSEMVAGSTRGLEADGALRLLTENDELILIQAGEVESLRENSDYIS